jgi:hypothetical protein
MLGGNAILSIDENSDVNAYLKKLTKHFENGGSYCFGCGIMFDKIIDARKHDFEKHYDYALAQCNGDKDKLQEWMNLEK